jgi:hypothetical protein
MANARPQFGLRQVFLGVTAFGFAISSIRSSGVTCYVLGAFAALLAGAAVLEHNKHAGVVAFGVMFGIYILRLVLP